MASAASITCFSTPLISLSTTEAQVGAGCVWAGAKEVLARRMVARSAWEVRIVVSSPLDYEMRTAGASRLDVGYARKFTYVGGSAREVPSVPIFLSSIFRSAPQDNANTRHRR